MKVFVKSDIGCVRENNEDSYLCNPPHLLVVADGMGGHVAGEIASKLAVETVRDYVIAHKGKISVDQMLSQAVLEANHKILALSKQEELYLGMGTTVSTAFVDGSKIYWAHVGDSRIYLLQDGKITQLTKDHSLVWELVEAGSITRAEAQNHPQRNVLTRAVGTTEKLKVDIGVAEWNPGDWLLLCTDGLTSLVSEEEIKAAIQIGNGEKIIDQLVYLAKASGGYDNITAILALYGDE